MGGKRRTAEYDTRLVAGRRHRASRLRGVTLVEVSVTCALLLLLMGAVYQLFTFSGRALLSSQTRANLQSTGLVVLNRMANEIRHAAFATMTVNAATTSLPPAIGFRMQDPADGQVGPLSLQPYFIVYYLDKTTRSIVRKCWGNVTNDKLTFTPSPLLLNTRLTATQLSQIVTNRNGSEQTMATLVDQLSFTPSPFPATAATSQIVVTVNLSAVVAGTTYMETASTAVAPRNKP